MAVAPSRAGRGEQRGEPVGEGRRGERERGAVGEPAVPRRPGAGRVVPAGGGPDAGRPRRAVHRGRGAGRRPGVGTDGQAVEHLAGQLHDRPALGPGRRRSDSKAARGRGAVPLGEDADRALDAHPRGQGVLELGDGALAGPRCGRPAGAASAVPSARRRARAPSGGPAVGLTERAELLGDQVGQRHPLDQVAGLARSPAGARPTQPLGVRVERDRRPPGGRGPSGPWAATGGSAASSRRAPAPGSGRPGGGCVRGRAPVGAIMPLRGPRAGDHAPGSWPAGP